MSSWKQDIEICKNTSKSIFKALFKVNRYIFGSKKSAKNQY